MTACRRFQQGPLKPLMILLAGAASTLAFAPFQLWPIAIISVAIFLYCLQNTSPIQAALRGWCFGFGFFLTSVSWVYVSIHNFGAASPALAISLTVLFAAGLAIFFAVHGALLSFILQKTNNSPGATLLIFPATWVLAEWFRSWFLTGFPWLLVGYAPLDTWLAYWAPITGIYGLSLFVAATSCCLVLFVQARKNTTRLWLISIVVLPFLLGLPLATLTLTQAKNDAFSVTLIQGNTPQQQKWNTHQRQAIIDTHVSLTLEHLDSALIIWPETAIPQLLDKAKPTIDKLDNFLLKNNTALITGIPSSQINDDRKHYYNSVIGLGTAKGVYHKQRLVPFGEYVPLESMLRGLIDFFDLPMSSFSLGPENQPTIKLHDDIAVSSYICYEIVYPDLVAKETGDLLLTVSNDAWFGDSLAPHQHLQMARMRALETGRYLIRATNNGISAIIAPNGEITARSPQFIATTLTGNVQPMSGATPFASTGSWPLLLIALLMVALGTALTRKPTREAR